MEYTLDEISEINIAIFASGTGSNAMALIEHALSINQTISCLICDNPQAKILTIIEKYNIPSYCIEFQRSNSSYSIDKQEQEKKILSILQQKKINWILLAGYMRILSESFLSHFKNNEYNINQVINIHPSLLPLYPGKNGLEQSYSCSTYKGGATIHFVDTGIDTGTIILQKSFNKEKDDTFEIFTTKQKKVEHEIYPKVLKMIFDHVLLKRYKS